MAFLSSALSRRVSPLWLLVVSLILIALNRLLGTVSDFDVSTGTVSVARILRNTVVFRRRFQMSEIARVFHDERPYLRSQFQNVRLELLTGRWGQAEPMVSG
jgi:hypothetical protein